MTYLLNLPKYYDIDSYSVYIFVSASIPFLFLSPSWFTFEANECTQFILHCWSQANDLPTSSNLLFIGMLLSEEACRITMYNWEMWQGANVWFIMMYFLWFNIQ